MVVVVVCARAFVHGSPAQLSLISTTQLAATLLSCRHGTMSSFFLAMVLVFSNEAAVCLVLSFFGFAHCPDLVIYLCLRVCVTNFTLFGVPAADGQQGLTVHKAHLPYDRQKTDLSWLRVPILIFGLVIVAVTQGKDLGLTLRGTGLFC